MNSRLPVTLKNVLLLAAYFAITSCDSATERPAKRYSQEEVSYFVDVALGAEFGGATRRIRKWQSDIRIKVAGTPTAEDERTQEQLTSELQTLAVGLSFSFVEDDANVELFIVPASEFNTYEPNYVPGNLGFFWVFWSGSSWIYRARILITTEGVTQQERSHLMREELTQSLGLMNDSNRYPESIFYQGWTDVVQFTELDKVLIQMLYDPEVRPGMTEEQAIAVQENLEVD